MYKKQVIQLLHHPGLKRSIQEKEPNKVLQSLHERQAVISKMCVRQLNYPPTRPYGSTNHTRPHGRSTNHSSLQLTCFQTLSCYRTGIYQPNITFPIAQHGGMPNRFKPSVDGNKATIMLLLDNRAHVEQLPHLS